MIDVVLYIVCLVLFLGLAAVIGFHFYKRIKTCQKCTPCPECVKCKVCEECPTCNPNPCSPVLQECPPCKTCSRSAECPKCTTEECPSCPTCPACDKTDCPVCVQCVDCGVCPKCNKCADTLTINYQPKTRDSKVIGNLISNGVTEFQNYICSNKETLKQELKNESSKQKPTVCNDKSVPPQFAELYRKYLCTDGMHDPDKYYQANESIFDALCYQEENIFE